MDDLVQVGAIGLLQAIDRFDPERGRDLVSFAIPTITGEIRNHLRDRAAPVRVPRRLAELEYRLRVSGEALSARLARAPTAAELARETGVPEAEVSEVAASERARATVSLAEVEEGPGDSHPSIVVDGVYDPSDRRLLLAAAFRALGERERRIVHLRYFAGLSQAEIAEAVGLSQVQVSRLIRSSLERMHRALRSVT